MKQKPQWIIYAAYMLAGIVIGFALTILFVERYYQKQINEINKELEPEDYSNIIINVTGIESSYPIPYRFSQLNL